MYTGKQLNNVGVKNRYTGIARNKSIERIC